MMQSTDREARRKIWSKAFNLSPYAHKMFQFWLGVGVSDWEFLRENFGFRFKHLNPPTPTRPELEVFMEKFDLSASTPPHPP